MHLTFIACTSADGSKTRLTMILLLQNFKFPCDFNPYIQYFEWSGTAEGLSKNIDCVTIPGHTSHVIQPLENGGFNGFKSQLSRFFETPETHDTSLVSLALVKASVKAINYATEPIRILSRRFRGPVYALSMRVLS